MLSRLCSYWQDSFFKLVNLLSARSRSYLRISDRKISTQTQCVSGRRTGGGWKRCLRALLLPSLRQMRGKSKGKEDAWVSHERRFESSTIMILVKIMLLCAFSQSTWYKIIPMINQTNFSIIDYIDCASVSYVNHISYHIRYPSVAVTSNLETMAAATCKSESGEQREEL